MRRADEVHDRRAARDRGGEGGCVECVACMRRRARRQPVFGAGPHERVNRVAAIEQRSDERTADVSRAAGDEDRPHAKDYAGGARTDGRRLTKAIDFDCQIGDAFGNDSNIVTEAFELYRRVPSIIGEVFPDIGKLLPDIGELFPDTGELFPDTGELFPDTGELFPDFLAQRRNLAAERHLERVDALPDPVDGLCSPGIHRAAAILASSDGGFDP